MDVPRRVADLPGWREDDLHLALQAYAATRPDGWPVPGKDPRAFFESAFDCGPASDGLLTGYYEPELDGAQRPTGKFRSPLYGLPPGLIVDGLGPERRWIEREKLASGHELAWVADPLDAFLAQVQGSVRIRLHDGGVLRLGFAARNGRPYRSIGAELVRRGAVPADAISVRAIRDWCRANPGAVNDLLHCNPSFVFFRAMDLPETRGPVGSAGVPVTPMRSIAADLSFFPAGMPVWLQSSGSERLNRLVIVQDTGSAIVGPGRADLFIGSGCAAGERAGRLHEASHLTPMLPR